MKSPFVNEIEPNRVITTSFLVHSKEIRQKKTGELYLSLILGDRTGDLDAKMWDNVGDVIDGFDRDDFVKVKGLIQVFHNRPQLTIHKMRRMDESEIDIGDYFPASKRDPEEMWRELRGIVDGVVNPHLKALLHALLDDEEIAQRFRRAPAAKQIHHAFLGGLLEHVLSLCTLARLAANHYAHIDYDLLLTGVVLHDIGKIYELNYERGFSYSNEGQLLGHMQIGLRMIGDKLRNLPDFPPRLRALVEHMILSHHGQLEFGSPKLPQFPEALLLHYLDDMDSKMECMRAMIDHDRQVEGCFTTYSSALSRTALKKERFLNGEAVKPRPVTPKSNGARALPETAPPETAPPAPLFGSAPSEASPLAALGATEPPTTPVAEQTAQANNHSTHTELAAPPAESPCGASPRPAQPTAKPLTAPVTEHAAQASNHSVQTAEPQTSRMMQRPAPPAEPPASQTIEPPIVVGPSAAQHPLFAPKPDSPFADKLRQALANPAPEQKG